MSMAVIQIEQHGFNAWVAEVEIGGNVTRREMVRAATFDGVMEKVAEVYWRLTPFSAAQTSSADLDYQTDKRGPGRPRRDDR